MSNYPNMSYCAVENTNSALGQVVDMISQFDSLDEFYESLSSDEKMAWRSLVDNVNLIRELHDEEDMMD